MPTTTEDWENEVLTDEEMSEAIKAAKELKMQKRLIREWNEKINSQELWKEPNARELFEGLRATKSKTGEWFKVTEHNRDVIYSLCLYFANDIKLESFRKDFKLDKGILLMGPPGVGKSHLMNYFIKNPHASYTIPTCKSIVEKYRTNWSRDEMSTTEFYSALQPAEFGHVYNQHFLGTCFGDLGSEQEANSYGNKRNVMEEIIFNRYETGLPFFYTHVTTNLDAEMIEKVYGQRLIDRLREMCNVLILKGESFR